MGLESFPQTDREDWQAMVNICKFFPDERALLEKVPISMAQRFLGSRQFLEVGWNFFGNTVGIMNRTTN